MAYCKKHKARHSHKRKSQKRKSRKQQRQSRKQRGGGSCAAMPMNRVNFQQQGGMADVNASSMLLDQPTQVQAESYGQVTAIDQAVAMAKAQAGGYRKSHRKSHRKGSRKSHRKGRKGQRGGMAPIDYSLSLQGNQPIYDEALSASGLRAGLGAQPFLMSQ
jgi:hypothetical protein